MKIGLGALLHIISVTHSDASKSVESAQAISDFLQGKHRGVVMLYPRDKQTPLNSPDDVAATTWIQRITLSLSAAAGESYNDVGAMSGESIQQLWEEGMVLIYVMHPTADRLIQDQILGPFAGVIEIHEGQTYALFTSGRLMRI